MSFDGHRVDINGHTVTAMTATDKDGHRIDSDGPFSTACSWTTVVQ